MKNTLNHIHVILHWHSRAYYSKPVHVPHMTLYADNLVHIVHILFMQFMSMDIFIYLQYIDEYCHMSFHNNKHNIINFLALINFK